MHCANFVLSRCHKQFVPLAPGRAWQLRVRVCCMGAVGFKATCTTRTRLDWPCRWRLCHHDADMKSTSLNVAHCRKDSVVAWVAGGKRMGGLGGRWETDGLWLGGSAMLGWRAHYGQPLGIWRAFVAVGWWLTAGAYRRLVRRLLVRENSCMAACLTYVCPAAPRLPLFVVTHSCTQGGLC